jgi:hypothetical protein
VRHGCRILLLTLLAAGPTGATGSASAEIVTLPAAASVIGASPFYSDVRAFNSSYTASLEVTAEYRCFIGSCAGGPRTFTLGPRESRAFDDVCVSLFESPDSAGAIELSHAGAAGSLVVTSRLYSTAPSPTVGMFVPGLPASEAHPVSVLTSLRNGGFRTNVGVYNPGPSPAEPVFHLYDGSTLLASLELVTPLQPRQGAQINDVFAQADAGSVSTGNALVVVESPEVPLFTYAAVIDNATSDPVFVSGAADSETPPASGPETVLIAVRAWDFSPGGPISPPLTLRVGTTYTLVFQNVDLPGTPGARHGFSGISELGLPATDDISPGHNFVVTGFAPQAWQRGSYPFVCTQSSCGGDPEQHAGMIGLLVVE